jgi:calcineurin-like phosphoesterase family protein
MIFFTSDEHHFHREIIDYCKQPFDTLESKMNTIIENHNKVVEENDTVIHLGDFSLFPPKASHTNPIWDTYNYVPMLENVLKKYKKVKERILIIGNHDEFSIKEYKEMGFTSVQEYITFEAESYTFFAVHDPSFYQPKIYDRICVCGHVHSLFRTIPGRKIFNVSVDVNDYMPVASNEVILALKVAGNLK